jgi:hypothetical protein
VGNNPFFVLPAFSLRNPCDPLFKPYGGKQSKRAGIIIPEWVSAYLSLSRSVPTFKISFHSEFFCTGLLENRPLIVFLRWASYFCPVSIQFLGRRDSTYAILSCKYVTLRPRQKRLLHDSLDEGICRVGIKFDTDFGRHFVREIKELFPRRDRHEQRCCAFFYRKLSNAYGIRY